MQTKVFCRTTAKSIQTFYVTVNGETKTLFSQTFRRSNKAFFEKGVNINSLGNFKNAHSESVRKTLDKLPSYLHYIEKEYDVIIYKKTESKKYKKTKPYKRSMFDWRDYMWEFA